MVAGLLGLGFAAYAGGATTFNEVAAGLDLPPVFLLAVVDWGLAGGSTVGLVLGAVALVLALVFVAVAVVLLRDHVLVVVHPLVAVLAVLDWVFGVTVDSPAASATLPTLGLLLVVALLVGVVGFEGGRRLT